MGSLTTFTIHNEGIDQILKNSGEFCKKLYQAARDRNFSYLNHEGFGGLVKVQETKLNQDYVIYVQFDGEVHEIDAFSKNTLRLIQEDPRSFKDILKYMKQQVGDLEKKFGRYQAEAKSQE